MFLQGWPFKGFFHRIATPDKLLEALKYVSFLLCVYLLYESRIFILHFNDILLVTPNATQRDKNKDGPGGREKLCRERVQGLKIQLIYRECENLFFFFFWVIKAELCFRSDTNPKKSHLFPAVSKLRCGYCLKNTWESKRVTALLGGDIEMSLCQHSISLLCSYGLLKYIEWCHHGKWAEQKQTLHVHPGQLAAIARIV